MPSKTLLRVVWDGFVSVINQRASSHSKVSWGALGLIMRRICPSLTFAAHSKANQGTFQRATARDGAHPSLITWHCIADFGSAECVFLLLRTDLSVIDSGALPYGSANLSYVQDGEIRR